MADGYLIPVEPERSRCADCGNVVEPTRCFCGARHAGTRCWPCHHEAVGADRCAAPHCPDHGYEAAMAWMDKMHGPPPCSACDAPTEGSWADLVAVGGTRLCAACLLATRVLHAGDEVPRG